MIYGLIHSTSCFIAIFYSFCDLIIKVVTKMYEMRLIFKLFMLYFGIYEWVFLCNDMEFDRQTEMSFVEDCVYFGWNKRFE
jgi:hypothetical protein